MHYYHTSIDSGATIDYSVMYCLSWKILLVKYLWFYLLRCLGHSVCRVVFGNDVIRSDDALVGVVL